VQGGFTQTSGGTLRVAIGGSSAPGVDFDQLRVNGFATLNGALEVTLAPGFIPTNGFTVPVLACAGRSGQFATLAVPTFTNGLVLRAVYSNTNITITAELP
jgi:hypothetical protein